MARYDDELWELVPEDPGPPPAHIAGFVRALAPAERALDLGVGDGRVATLVSAARLTGADVSQVALDRARTLYGRAQNWTKAEEQYRSVVALGVDLASAHYDYGVLLGLQGKWELAAEAYRRAIAVNPLHAQAYNNLGQILERQRRIDEAADAYRHAVESAYRFYSYGDCMLIR